MTTRQTIGVDRGSHEGSWSEKLLAWVGPNGVILETLEAYEARGPHNLKPDTSEPSPTVRCYDCKGAVYLVPYGDGWTDAPHECRRAPR